VPSTVFVVASDFSSRISGIAIDDLTGDGFDDVALLWEDFLADGSVHRELNVHHGSTDGLVLKRRNYLRGSQFRYPASSGVTLAAAGDVDADGLGDLVIVSGEFPFNLFWLPGRSSGLSSQPDFFGLADANVKGLGDFNGDGFADLVAPIIGGNFWRLDIYAGGPEGYLTTPVLAVGPIADLIGTEPGYDAAGGRVFVFLGRPTP
jgi:hypothetical protein